MLNIQLDQFLYGILGLPDKVTLLDMNPQDTEFLSQYLSKMVFTGKDLVTVLKKWIDMLEDTIDPADKSVYNKLREDIKRIDEATGEVKLINKVTQAKSKAAVTSDDTPAVEKRPIVPTDKSLGAKVGDTGDRDITTDDVEIPMEHDEEDKPEAAPEGKGLAMKKGVTEDDVDPDELAKGLDVEREHTDDPEQRKQTALDHLAEDPKYYTHLEEMESEHAGDAAADQEDEEAANESHEKVITLNDIFKRRQNKI
jgi:hypothetical protein